MKLQKIALLLLPTALLILGMSCSDKQPTDLHTPGGTKDMNHMSEKLRDAQREALRALPRQVIHPKNNPNSSVKVELGRLLFFDPILSGSKDVACATCHHPSTGYAEFRDLPIGVNGQGLGRKRTFKEPNDIPFTKRNTPTVLNTAFNGLDNINPYDPEQAPMFWDNRERSLEKQALGPIHAFEEMRGHDFTEQEITTELERRLQAIPAYVRLFTEAFPAAEAITLDHATQAIATFERRLVTTDSRFDQYKRGNMDALSLSEKHGLETFIRVGCTKCHHGPMLSDFKTHVLGVPHHVQLSTPDLGLDETGAFRTPTLRNLRYTAPYMHNGKFSTLEKVLEFYEDMALKNTQLLSVEYEQLDPHARAITIKTRDIGPIIAFLNTLNGERFDVAIPQDVPSGLPVGGYIH